MDATALKFVVVEGAIGVGKTSLARRLAKTFESDLLLEQPAENPFLERFYRDPKASALPTQLFFLFQRVQQFAEMRQTDMFQPRRVADFMLAKDRMFAEVTLDKDEFDLYCQVYEKLTLESPTPDLVIYLQAPVEVLRQRVSKRGIDYEQNITLDYLQQLHEAYTRYFYYYDASPCLIVNAAEIDPVNNDQDYANLLATIAGIKTGKHYFNSMAA